MRWTYWAGLQFEQAHDDELAVPPHARARVFAAMPSLDGPALGAFALGFAPVLYLALRGGGYDTIVYSEAGFAAWGLMLLGVLFGVLPLQRLTRLAWVSACLFGAFAVWTLIASAWSASTERTVGDLGEVVTYLGWFVLGLCVLGRDTIRPLVLGMGSSIALVGLLAVASRLFPGALAADHTGQLLGSHARLNYPLNYWNGTGIFLALGLPLLLSIGTSRRPSVQAAASAAIPIAALGIVMTASRGAAVTAIVAVAVFFALAPDRVPKVCTALVSVAGSAILIAAFLHRHALREGLSTPAASSQRHQLTLLLALVCAGTALLRVAVELAFRRVARPRQLVVGRARAVRLTLAALALAAVFAVAAGIPGKVAHQWNVFKKPNIAGLAAGNTFTRLGTLSGSHRYQYWQAAVDAFESRPVLGIGPGTFEFYWAQHRSLGDYVRNAHSLYLETLAETGVVGFVPIAGFLLTLLAAGVVRCLRAPPPQRVALAAATATFAGFLAAAAYDWMWQLPCVALAALLMGAAIVSHDKPSAGEQGRPAGSPWAIRGALALPAIAALFAIATPFAMTEAIRSSQAAAGAGHLKAALSDALTAQSLEPYAATPRLQQALVLEQQRQFAGARGAIGQAASREPTNWQIWLVRARIDAESGHALEAVRDYKRAHSLNPLSPATAE